MRRTLGAIGMAAGAALLAGCAGEAAEAPPPARPGVYATMRATQLLTVGAPGPADLPFGEALVTYSRMLGDVHAWQGARSDEAIREATLQLATVIERMPAAGAEPALRRAAIAMRREVSAGDAEAVKRALARGATEIMWLAESAYRDAPNVLDRARDLGGAVDAIDPLLVPLDRSSYIRALLRAERALAAMYAANVAPPRP
jgi:hypothetical protein